jgi:hypothetical protein
MDVAGGEVGSSERLSTLSLAPVARTTQPSRNDLERRVDWVPARRASRTGQRSADDRDLLDRARAGGYPVWPHGLEAEPMTAKHKGLGSAGRTLIDQSTFRKIEFSNYKSASMRLRVTPQQKAEITEDAKNLGVSATELLLQLHRIASPSLRKKKRR